MEQEPRIDIDTIVKRYEMDCFRAEGDFTLGILCRKFTEIKSNLMSAELEYEEKFKELSLLKETMQTCTARLKELTASIYTLAGKNVQS